MGRFRALLVVMVLAAAAGCSSDDTGDVAQSDIAAVSSSTSTPSTSSTTTTLPPERDYAVGEHKVELVDPTRPTAAAPNRGLPERSERTIPLLVLYPAEGEPDADVTVIKDAPVAEGEFPLVVFSHGVTATGDLYLGLLSRWAKEGYIIAAPTFPLTSGPGAGINDYANQPDDVRFVLDEVLLRSDEPDHLLHDHIDEERIAIAGHSLGAVTTIGAAFNACCRDERIDAAIEISGIEVPFPEGSYDDWPDVPLLAIHGEKDGTVPFGGSEALIAKAPPPSYFLRFPDGGHSDVLGGPSGDVLDEVVLAFLDRYLKDDPRGLEEVPDEVAASGLASLEINES